MRRASAGTSPGTERISTTQATIWLIVSPVREMGKRPSPEKGDHNCRSPFFTLSQNNLGEVKGNGRGIGAVTSEALHPPLVGGSEIADILFRPRFPGRGTAADARRSLPVT